MYSYIIGTVVEIGSNFVVVDSNKIGYFIYMADAFTLEIGLEYKLYIYQNVSENDLSLYGFKSLLDKELFLKIINVKGVGCKTALPFLIGNRDDLLSAIENEDVVFLKSFPKIGEKVARQVILDLKGKLNFSCENVILRDILLSLGYKTSEVSNVVNKVNDKDSLELQIKDALNKIKK